MFFDFDAVLSVRFFLIFSCLVLRSKWINWKINRRIRCFQRKIFKNSSIDLFIQRRNSFKLWCRLIILFIVLRICSCLPTILKVLFSNSVNCTSFSVKSWLLFWLIRLYQNIWKANSLGVGRPSVYFRKMFWLWSFGWNFNIQMNLLFRQHI